MRIIIIFSMIAFCKTETQILDYTSAQIVTLETGLAKLETGTFKLIHVIDLGQYETVINELETIIERDITERNYDYSFLIREVRTITDILRDLTPRRGVRSINMLGTAWKWIAGTPDYDDFQIVSDKVNNLLRNNNKQVVINRAIELKVREITNITNRILNNIGSSESLKTAILRDVERKLGIIKEELVNIGYSIQWAKSGIINSFIFSGSELNITKKFFELQDMPYLNLIEALEFGEVRIGMNKTTILYIVNLPQTEKETCKQFLIKPVKKGKIAIKLESENFVICKKTFLKIESRCRTLNDISICKKENFKNIILTNCLPNLLTGMPSNCLVTNNQHMPTVEELSPGMLLLNGYNGTIEMENDKIYLEGTFLIKYRNSTITIKDRTYSNHEIAIINRLPAIIQTTNFAANYEEMLSLEMLKELHIDNAEEIRELAHRYRATLATSLAFPTVAMLIMIALIIRAFIRRKKTFEIKIDSAHNKSVDIATPSIVDAGI